MAIPILANFCLKQPPSSWRLPAAKLGVCKVNVNSELRESYLGRLAERLPDAMVGLRLLELEAAVVEAVAAVVGEKLDLLSPQAA